MDPAHRRRSRPLPPIRVRRARRPRAGAEIQLTDPAWHLAQLNVARLAAPLDSPQLAGFVAGLDPINAIADATPGFVWRLQTEAGDATSVQAFDDPMRLVNLSVWESLDVLRLFVYRGAHAQIMRGRRQWFEKATGPDTVLWWVAARHLPTVDEAVARLDTLEQVGPSPAAFTFRHAFDPSGEPVAEVRIGIEIEKTTP